jgi:hypothetical protein
MGVHTRAVVLRQGAIEVVRYELDEFAADERVLLLAAAP